MEETKVKRISITHKLSIGNCSIEAVVNENGRITLSHHTDKHGHNKEFIFENSTADVVYIIGTLIRDAADLVSSIPPDRSD